MCGICGYIGIREEGLLESMTEALVHRGPDSVGYFSEGEVGLGFRRLSIIDVAGGQQPIENEKGSLVLVCNGEIYNYQELREQLLARNHDFRTKSDSEVVLHLFEEEGPECLQRLNGMFTIAIYDKNKRQLFLARDRLGIKPLYYVSLNGSLLFASESKALLRFTGFDLTLNANAVDHYLRLRYVPGPEGLIEEVRKLPAGHWATFKNGQLTLRQYWRPELFEGPFNRDEQSYVEGFAEQFDRSIKRRLISEVPLGAYLSGGLDSSVIVAAVSQQTSKPVQTFSVGFDYEHDELAEAALVAKEFGCVHTEVMCRPSDIDLLPDIVYHLDEPIGDAIVIPMYQLAQEAAKRVTVVLTGEGADELLGGYLFHKALLMSNRLARLIPRVLQRAVLSPAVALFPSALINLAFDYPAKLGKRGKYKLVDFLKLMEPDLLEQAYFHLISLFDNRDIGALYSEEFMLSLNGHESMYDRSIVESDAPALNRIIHLQFSHWLQDDILMKQDKMTMAHGLEGRVPFLDHEMVEYALQIPPSLKIRNGVTKYVLREYAGRVLPKEITARKKVPFYIPLENYFSEPAFQELMHDTLSETSIRSRGLFRPSAVERLVKSMDRGEFIYVKQVFSLMVLELWFRVMMDRRGLC